MRDLTGLLERPGLEPGIRALIAANASMYAAQWDRFAACLDAARKDGVDRSQAEEMLLQAVLYFGFPRAITAFERMQQDWPVDRPPAGGGLPLPERESAGRSVFDTIYGANSGAVRSMLESMHQELHDFVLHVAYGRILTRPGLVPKLRELLAVGALESLAQVPQLVAHARGALAFGATETEVREAIFTARLDESGIDETMRRVLRN